MSTQSIRGAIALVIPALEPTEALPQLIEQLRPAWDGPIVVVDDGSASKRAAATFAQAEALGCTVLAHPENRGKGAALKTAFSWCLDRAPGPVLGAVTADADGQHLPEDIVAVRDALAEHADSLILGCRDFSKPETPPRSKAGNRTMSAAVRLFFGMQLSDTQTGLRGIPRAFMRDLLRVSGDTYAFETNMLIEAHSRDLDILEVPIATVYENGNAGSHFNPVLDSLRVAAVFLRYTLSSAASSIIDLAAFALFDLAFAAIGLGGLAIATATFAARAVSGVANFLINRHLVFKRGDTGRGAVRYAMLWVACACASATLVTAISSLIPAAPPVAIKVVVDVALFFANYRIQEAWVFKSDRQTHEAA